MFKAQESLVVAPRWKETKRPKILHKKNKWTQSDDLIETDGVAKHYYEWAPTNFNHSQL
jgi:hypothetical protein